MGECTLYRICLISSVFDKLYNDIDKKYLRSVYRHLLCIFTVDVRVYSSNIIIFNKPTIYLLRRGDKQNTIRVNIRSGFPFKLGKERFGFAFIEIIFVDRKTPFFLLFFCPPLAASTCAVRNHETHLAWIENSGFVMKSLHRNLRNHPGRDFMALIKLHKYALQ